jgi:hypothetical protein
MRPNHKKNTNSNNNNNNNKNKNNNNNKQQQQQQQQMNQTKHLIKTVINKDCKAAHTPTWIVHLTLQVASSPSTIGSTSRWLWLSANL